MARLGIALWCLVLTCAAVLNAVAASAAAGSTCNDAAGMSGLTELLLSRNNSGIATRHTIGVGGSKCGSAETSGTAHEHEHEHEHGRQREREPALRLDLAGRDKVSLVFGSRLDSEPIDPDAVYAVFVPVSRGGAAASLRPRRRARTLKCVTCEKPDKSVEVDLYNLDAAAGDYDFAVLYGHDSELLLPMHRVARVNWRPIGFDGDAEPGRPAPLLKEIEHVFRNEERPSKLLLAVPFTCGVVLIFFSLLARWKSMSRSQSKSRRHSGRGLQSQEPISSFLVIGGVLTGYAALVLAYWICLNLLQLLPLLCVYSVLAAPALQCAIRKVLSPPPSQFASTKQD